MPNSHKPAIIALVVCDNIYQEESGKTALVGLFNRLTGSSFPLRHPKLAVFVSVTDMAPDSVGKLEVVSLESDHTVAEAKGDFPGPVGRLTVVDMNFILKNLVFPEPGIYSIRFSVNGHPLAERRFEVVKPKRKEEKGADE